MTLLFSDEKYQSLSNRRLHIFESLGRQGANSATVRSLQMVDAQLRDYVWKFITDRAASVGPMSQADDKEFEHLIPEENKELYTSATKDLDCAVFLFDVIETIINSANAKLARVIPGTSLRAEMFDGVISSGEQIRNALKYTRDTADARQQTVFAYYAESIFSYLRGRTNTYFKMLKDVREGRTDRLPESLQEDLELISRDTTNDGFQRTVDERVRLLEEANDLREQLNEGLRVVLDGYKALSNNEKDHIVDDMNLAYEDYIKHGIPGRLTSFIDTIQSRYKCFAKIVGLKEDVAMYLVQSCDQFLIVASKLHADKRD